MKPAPGHHAVHDPDLGLDLDKPVELTVDSADPHIHVAAGPGAARPGHLLPLSPDFWSVTPRWAVRRRLPDGSVSDVVGHVLLADPRGVVLLPQDGPAVRIDGADLLARRVVPPRAARPASSAQAIDLTAARGWPGTAVWRLGGWLLRAGGGYSNRANSCLVHGDPGVPVAEALRIVADHYSGQRLTPVLALAHDIGRPPDHDAAAVESAADATGWQPYGATILFTADLRRLPKGAVATGGSAPDADDAHRPSPADGARWTELPEPDWLRTLHQGEALSHPEAEAVITSTPARYLTLRDHAGQVNAIGRLVRSDDWAGLSCIEVDGRRRGRGLGRLVTTVLLDRASREGARFAYVQVGATNTAAAGLYLSMGLTPHHTYHYRRLVALSQARQSIATSASAVAAGSTALHGASKGSGGGVPPQAGHSGL